MTMIYDPDTGAVMTDVPEVSASRREAARVLAAALEGFCTAHADGPYKLSIDLRFEVHAPSPLGIRGGVHLGCATSDAIRQRAYVDLSAALETRKAGTAVAGV